MKYIFVQKLKTVAKKKKKSKQVPGMNAPAGFSIKDWLKKHPANPKVVKDVLKKIDSHVKVSENTKKPNFSEWYIGVTNKSDTRRSAHKRVRNSEELTHYKKFYAYSMSNARAIEEKFHQKYKDKSVSGGIYTTSKYVYTFQEKVARLNGLL